uniref:Protein TOPAZ1 n=1 Tax=Crocodylus porosus TaxID=8502 RepID=A0A7M4EAQ4_CROPO
MPQLRSGRGLAVSPPGGGSHRLRSRRGRRGRGAGDAAGGRGEVAELPAGKGWARAPGRRRQLLPSVEALAGGSGAVQSTEAESGDSSRGLAEQVAGVEEQAGSLPVSGGAERRVGGRREKDGDALTLGQRVLAFEGKHRGPNERSGGAVGDVGKSRQRSFSEPGVQVPKEPESPVQEDRHASVELGSGGAAESPRKRGRCSLSEPGPQEKERCPGERGESFLAEVGLSGPLDKEGKEGNLGKQDRLIVEPKLQKPKKRGRYSLGMWQPLGAQELASSRKREKHSLELESQSLGLQGAVSNLGEVGEEKSFFNAESMAPQDHSNLKSPGVIRLVSDISNCCSDSGSCQKKLLNEKLFKKPEKLQAFSCQRAIPMTGKNVWPRESCARTSVWFPKKDKSIIEKKNSLTSFQGCSHQNTKTLRGMDVTDNSKQLDLHMSMTEINKQNACKITDSNTECLASVAILESSLSDINGALRVTKDENLELSLDKGRSSMTFNSGSVQEGKITLNLSGKQKQDKNKGALKAKNVAMTSQDSMCADNVGKMICNPEMPVTKQTQEFPGLVRMLSTGNLSNFKIPLLRNKTESRKVDYIRSFERETYSPLELLDNSAATPVRQNRSKENSPLVYSDFFLATAKEKAYQITNKDLGNDDSERLSDEKKRLAEHVSACPWDFPERELMSLTSEDTFGTEFREKSNEADHSSKIVKHSTSSEVFVNDEKKLKEKPTQSSSTNFPDVLKAYEDDILVIDVIQDDPDLFGTTNEGEFELDCETEKHGNTLTPVEKQNFTPKFHNLQENKDSNYYHEYARSVFFVFNLNSVCKMSTFKHQHSLVTVFQVSLKTTPAAAAATVMGEAMVSWVLHVNPSWTACRPLVSHSIQKILEIELPRKYCRFYFNTLRGCERAECWFWHVPEQGDEKICMAVLRTYINMNETSLLQRAVQIFMNYYREVIPGVHFDLQVLNDLLIALLKHCLLKEVFPLLNIGIMIKRLPPIDVILKVFEHVASMNNREAVPKLIDAFCKLFDAGMGFESEHFNYIVKFLHQLQVSSQEINTVLNIKSRFQAKQFKKNWLCDINMAIAEIQHCKEKSDWSSLGTLYINVRMGCQNFGDLQKLTLCIAEILTRDSTGERPGVPFCEFAETVIKNPQHNEGDKIFLGRIGINVMYSYHRVLQWSKGRKVLDKLHEFQIYFTSLKGLTGPERLASRCQIVNVAAEIFLKSGSLDGATWVLRDSEWVIDTAVWPCDRMDVLSRHNLLCALACEYLTKSQYRQTFEILQNLPGFQTCSDTLDVSQYSLLFNKLLDACIESKSLGVSSSVIDFMFSKNVPIDFTLLRGLITTLGRSCLWLKARTYYKSALSLGCYPPLEGNLYRKLLLIPSYMSEVEMLLAIEIFLVSNASNIQSPGATSQTLQIILKRCEEHKMQSKDNYRTAMDRVILAARISDPKLFLKHMTMNINMEQVYSLEHNSAIKWLKENMKWAGKVWLFQ